MAEIPIERKESRGWMWVLIAAVVAALLLWWLLAARRPDRDVADGEALTPPVVTTTSAVGYGAGAPVDDFLAWSDQTRAAAAAGPNHDYVATGITRLATAIADLAARDSLGGSAVAQQVQALNRMADQVQQDADVLTHADVVHAAFVSSAALLADIQQHRFPSAASAVADVRDAANAIDKNRPLLDQKDAMQHFFDQAATAVRAMRTNT